jgi:tripartite-type tricarboxylate transporter receptor subunit TctC
MRDLWRLEKTKGCRLYTTIFFLMANLLLMGTCVTIVKAAEFVYPNRAITLIVPFAAGGVTDLGARALAEHLQKQLKQPVAVENKPGGATTIAGQAVVTAKPEGYTLGFFPGATTLPEEYTYFYSAPYTSADLRPICSVLTPVLAIAVRNDAPWKDLKEFVEYARKNPRLKFAHPGKSTQQYVVMVSIAKQENLTLVDVPYGGDGEMVPALLGGHVDVGLIALPAIKSLIDAGKIRALALCTEKRASYVPDIPSTTEFGYKLPYVPFLALYGPKKIPDEVVKKLDEASGRIAKDEDFRRKANDLCLELSYESTASFEKSLVKYRQSLSTFFKAEGMTK